MSAESPRLAQVLGGPGKTAAWPEGRTQATSGGTRYSPAAFGEGCDPGAVMAPARQTAAQFSTATGGSSGAVPPGRAALLMLVPGKSSPKLVLIVL